MVAVPLFTPFITPLESAYATLLLEELYIILAPVSTLSITNFFVFPLLIVMLLCLPVGITSSSANSYFEK